VAHAAQLGDALQRHLEPHQAQHLGIAVLLDDGDPIVTVDEPGQVERERARTEAQVGLPQACVPRELVAALGRGPVRRAEGREADAGAGLEIHDGGGHEAAHRLELVRQPIEVAHVVVGPLAVHGALVVAGAAREVGRQTVERHGPIGDAVHVPVAPPVLQLGELLRREALAAARGRVGVRERLRHPGVHALVEVHHHEDQDWNCSARSNATIAIR
jgi:hypothetical protein